MFELWRDNFKEKKNMEFILLCLKGKQHWEDGINSHLPIYTFSVRLQLMT